LFTSSLPGEGKTAVTLSFGRFLAMSGRATVVVDCDLRKPSVHGTLRGRAAPGLVDHLLGDATLDEVVQMDDPTGLHYIAAGPPAANPTDLFTSGPMHATLAELSKRYDVVLLDSAPVLAVADTRCLNRLVDHTVFVIRWSATQRSTAREAIRRLHDEANLNTASAVLNMVDTKVYRQYDFGYYYDAVKGYYGE
jgi:capsular exopolysaccharide synthesis family protein